MRNYVRQLFLLVLLSSVWLSASANVFLDARQAATEGRYRDVIGLLSEVIEAGELEPAEMVVAFSNRGIAYSLLKAFELARIDLNRAISIDPDHKLTQNQLGLIAQHVDADYATAYTWFKRAASQGFPASQVNLGRLYEQGLGTQKNPSEAFRYFSLADEQGYDMALLPLGNMLLNGSGARRDRTRAIEYFKRAAAKGVIEAHYSLGMMYERGWGTSSNLYLASQHYHEAAIQGNANAQNALGYLYRRGSGVPQDFVEAVRWYRLAADQGILQAANRLAWLLATCPVTEVCNGAQALSFARIAVEQSRSATNLDSMAAAYARLGDFDNAIAMIEEILASTDTRKSRYRNRLDLYRQGRPYQL